MKLLQKIIVLVVILATVPVRAQDKGYDVTQYDATLTIERARNFLAGHVTMKAVATTDSLSAILQHLKGLTIDSIFVGSLKAGLTQRDSTDGSYFVTGFTPIALHSAFELTTYYHGNPGNEGGTNPWGGVTNDGKMMFAMGVGFSAPFVSTTRFWLPCYDEPDDKADTVTLRFTVPDSDVVASNGVIESHLDAIARTRISVCRVTHPIASYLLTFAVGPFSLVVDKGPSSLPIIGYCYSSDSLRLRTLFDRRIVRTIALYDSLFGPYPFEKVGYVVAPIGSMEHQTMITLINQAIDTNSTTPQHELAHMWWGDWVTCKDFNDPWLNEGFATFCESLVLEHDVSTARYWQKQKANITGALTSRGASIAMYGAPFHTTPRDNYPYEVIYQKGAAVLGMLRYMLGDSIFFPALRAYGNAHRYGNATSYDLQHDLEQFTGQDLHWFFKQWVFGTWYPQIKVSYSRAGASYTLNLQQVQDPAKYQYFRVPFVVEARTKGGLTDRTVVWMDSVAFTTVNVFCAFAPDTIVVDPDGAVIKKITSVTTLDVPPTQPVSMDIRYSVQFMPNPSKSTTPKLVVSALPFVHTDLFDETTYQLQRLNELTGESAELLLFDSNGHKVVGGPLSRPESVSRRGNDVSYVFGLPFAPLSSGTYFAKVVLNNTVVGEAQLVVTK
ncbi:MAG: M1 family metallopeptidase [Bacteroidetes bacterium]|nr:M1 family metallopeptidase [Bacteroidota bacterium]